MSSYHSQQQTLAQLPVPGEDEIAQSTRLVDFIVSEISQHGGVISFDQYMNHVLYHAGMGYYSAGSSKFGESGDFVTAPEISPLFGVVLARQCKEIFEQGCERRIFEFGAGSGKLCAQLMNRLGNLKSYLILEISADLRNRQQTCLKSCLSESQFDRIRWLDRLPDKFDGIVIGNEVLDAMPVNVVLKNQQWCELGIAFDGRRFAWCEYATDSLAVQAMQKIEHEQGLLPNGYCSEVNLNYKPWLESLNICTNSVAVLMVDYGYERAQYYHPDRSSGTLICHYRHRAHTDPLVYPGLQDITAFVDFDAFADAAVETGFELCGLTTQACFLIGNGLLGEAQKLYAEYNPEQQVALSQQIRTLTLPAEMGDKFKVIALQKNLNLELAVFKENRFDG